MDLRILKLFREFLANKTVTLPSNLLSRMQNVYLIICKKLLYYQKNQKDMEKNINNNMNIGNKKKKESVIKFVDNAFLNGNKTILSSFLNVFQNMQLLKCNNYLNCEDIKILTNKLVYNSVYTDINKNKNLTRIDENKKQAENNNPMDNVYINNIFDRIKNDLYKENFITYGNINNTQEEDDKIHNPDDNHHHMEKTKENNIFKNNLYYIKMNNMKNICLYDDYDIFNNLKTKNEALNCVNAIVTDMNSSAKKNDNANFKKRKTIDSSLNEVRNSIRERDLRRLNREKSKIL